MGRRGVSECSRTLTADVRTGLDHRGRVRITYGGLLTEFSVSARAYPSDAGRWVHPLRHCLPRMAAYQQRRRRLLAPSRPQGEIRPMLIPSRPADESARRPTRASCTLTARSWSAERPPPAPPLADDSEHECLTYVQRFDELPTASLYVGVNWMRDPAPAFGTGQARSSTCCTGAVILCRFPDNLGQTCDAFVAVSGNEA